MNLSPSVTITDAPLNLNSPDPLMDINMLVSCCKRKEEWREGGREGEKEGREGREGRREGRREGMSE